MTAVVVIPTYNEAGNLEELLDGILRASPDVEVLIVDDNSPDGTAAVAEARGDRRVHVLNRLEREGLGVAYRAGFEWALAHDYDVIAGMDADLSHDPAYLPDVLAPLANGADLVIGSRYIAGGAIGDWPLSRRLLSRFGNRYARIMLGVPMNDLTSGYRAYRSEWIARLLKDDIRAEGYGFLIECAYRVAAEGGRVAEVPIRFADRTWGDSKMNPATAKETLRLVTKWGIQRRRRR